LRDNGAVTIMLPPRPRILILFVAAFSSRSPRYNEKAECGVVPVTERFGGFRRIGLHKTRVAVRQVHRKEVDLALDLRDLRQRLAKIHLRMARIVPATAQTLRDAAAAAPARSP
jgi:hypothetical protein